MWTWSTRFFAETQSLEKIGQYAGNREKLFANPGARRIVALMLVQHLGTQPG
jgi:hypothetical protein